MHSEEIPPETLAPLAELLNRMRPDWDLPGIKRTIWNARRQPDHNLFIIAAVRAASNHGNRTPAVIPLEGSHWRDKPAPPATARTTGPDGNDTSEECDRHPGIKAWECRTCRKGSPRPANFEELKAQAAAQAKAERDARIDPPANGPETGTGETGTPPPGEEPTEDNPDA